MANEREINELSDGVASELYRLAITKNYPLNPTISLDSFFESFDEWGVDVRLDDKSKKAWFDFKHTISGIDYLAPVECSYQQILDGGGSYVAGSLGAISHTASAIMLTSGKVLANNYGSRLSEEQRKGFVNHFHRDFSGFSSIFARLITDYFGKYHEHILISPEGGIPKLKESDIIPVVLDQVNWDEYKDTLRDIGNNKSELAAFRGFFNILFFSELIKTRGYPLRKIPFRQASYDPIEKFADGKDIVWRNLPSLV